MGDEGAIALSKALKENTTLTKLYLNSEQTLTRNGGQNEIPQNSLRHNTVNFIGKEGMRHLSKALETNTTLTLLSVGGKQRKKHAA